jgi:hypothetical protein
VRERCEGNHAGVRGAHEADEGGSAELN